MKKYNIVFHKKFKFWLTKGACGKPHTQKVQCFTEKRRRLNLLCWNQFPRRFEMVSSQAWVCFLRIETHISVSAKTLIGPWTHKRNINDNHNWARTCYMKALEWSSSKMAMQEDVYVLAVAGNGQQWRRGCWSISRLRQFFQNLHLKNQNGSLLESTKTAAREHQHRTSQDSVVFCLALPRLVAGVAITEAPASAVI